jgi:FixJ family two-component response regulator
MVTPSRATVYIVDDDELARSALAFLIESLGWQAKTFCSAQEFLDNYQPAKPECLVLDVRMPGMNGLDLQEVLPARNIRLPVIFLTAYAEVTMAVRAVKAGAFDLIEKPFNDELLLERVEQCLKQDAEALQHHARRAENEAKLRSLTPREREVMDLLVAGQRTKVIAAELGISIRTAERHRASVMKKLRAKSLSDVVRMVLTD